LVLEKRNQLARHHHTERAWRLSTHDEIRRKEMKWILNAFVAVFLVLGAHNANAGAGHYHGPVNEHQASKIAESIVHNMARQGSLPTSWGQTPIGSLGKTSLDGNTVWQARFSNAEETNAEKRKMNVYLSLTGGFIKAEYATK
jgi:hypothetical protein